MVAKTNRYSDKIYNDIWLPEESLEIRKKVRAFAEKHLSPVAHKLNNTPEDTSLFPLDLLKTMGDEGLLAIPFSKQYGGAALTYPTLATMIMLEELAYFSSGVAAALIDVPLILFGHTLMHAQSAVKASLFPKLISGDLVGAFATSEPMASSDLSVNALHTEAKKVDGGYVVNGQKRWITNAPVAAQMFVLCKLQGELTMLLIDMSSQGVKVGEPDKKMGNLSQLTADIQFKDVFVPDSHLVGVEGKGLKTALRSLSMGRVGIGACGVGMAQAAFDFAADYMKSRTIFGQTISQFQYWQFKWADYATEIENARNLYVKAAMIADKYDSKEPGIYAMAKMTGSALAGTIARDAIQVCGGYGFVKELAFDGRQFPLEAIYRDSKIGEIYEGANEVQRLVIARGIFGK